MDKKKAKTLEQPTVDEALAYTYGKRDELLELPNTDMDEANDAPLTDEQVAEIEQGSHYSASYNARHKTTDDIKKEMLLVERLRMRNAFPAPNAVIRAMHDPLYRFIAFLEWKFHFMISGIQYDRDRITLSVIDDFCPIRTFELDCEANKMLFLPLELFTNQPYTRGIAFDRKRYERYLDYICARYNFEPYGSAGFVEQLNEPPASILWHDKGEDTVYEEHADKAKKEVAFVFGESDENSDIPF